MSNYPPYSERDEHRTCEAGPQTIYVADYHVLLDLHGAERRLRFAFFSKLRAFKVLFNAL